MASLRARLADFTSTAPSDDDEAVGSSKPSSTGKHNSGRKKSDSVLSKQKTKNNPSRPSPKSLNIEDEDDTGTWDTSYTTLSAQKRSSSVKVVSGGKHSSSTKRADVLNLQERKKKRQNDEDEEDEDEDEEEDSNDEDDAQDEDDEDEIPEMPRSSMRARAQFIADIESDPKYAGKVVSTKTALKHVGKAAAATSTQDDDEEEDEEEEEEEEDDSESDDDDDNDDDDDDNEEEEGDSSSGFDDEEEEEGNGNNDNAGRLREHTARKSNDLDAELQELAAADTAAMIRYRRNREDDISKGQAAGIQIELFEKWLGYRIAVQQLLQSGTLKLPLQPLQKELCTQNADVKESYSQTRDALAALLVDLLSLRANLLSAIPEVANTVATSNDANRDENDEEEEDEEDEEGEDDDGDAKSKKRKQSKTRTRAEKALSPTSLLASISGAGRKRPRTQDSSSSNNNNKQDDDDDDDTTTRLIAAGTSSEDLWVLINKGWEGMGKWRDTTVNKWGKRLAYASGLSAKKAVKLRVLGADISAQVAEVLANTHRITSRTRMKKASVHRLCTPPPPPAPTTSTSSVASIEASGATSSSSSASTKVVLSDDLDAETYDDTDFYAALLKEFTSGGIAGDSNSSMFGAGGGGGSSNTTTTTSTAPRGYKEGYSHSSNPNVDRKASKARRLRYVVHPKLAHFCTGSPYIVPPDMGVDLDMLLASLFKS